MACCVLVPLDGSGGDEAALPQGARLARGGEVHLVHVIPAFAPPVGLPARRVLALPEQAQEYLDDVRRRHPGIAGRDFVLAGDAADRILKLALEVNAAAISMGTHARAGPARWWLGSVAHEVVARAGIPVLVTPPGAPPPAGDLRRILVPMERPAPGGILDAVAPLARAWRAEVVLIHAVDEVPDPNFVPEHPPGFISHDPVRVYGDVADALDQEGIEAWAVVTKGDPVAEILRYASSLRADLIAMATHAPEGLERAILGSVAEGVLRRAGRPLLLIKTAVRAPVKEGGVP
jgi:nucleotide-binding universal stress UspA family protein